MNLVMPPAASLFPSSPGEAGLEDVPFLICVICMVATSSRGYVKSPEGKFSKEKHLKKNNKNKNQSFVLVVIS